MTSLHEVAYKLGAGLAREAGQEERSAVLGYGLEILLGEAIKIFVLLSTAALLGLFPTTALALAVAVAYRLISGGAHCSAYYRCLLASLLVFLTLGGASEFLAVVFPGAARPLALLLAGYSLLAAWRFAPAPPPQKPLNTEQKRLRRAWSLAFAAAWLPALAFLPFPPASLLALAGGLAWQAFTLTPGGNSFLERLDRALMVLNFLERRCRACGRL